MTKAPLNIKKGSTHIYSINESMLTPDYNSAYRDTG